MQNGDIKNFRLSNQCSAGNGMLLQAMADQFGVKITEYADTAFGAELAPKFSYGCAVFLDSDRVNFQKEGYSKEELLAGPGPGAAQERLAIRGADPAHGLAGQEVRPAGRDPVQPGGGQGPGRLHQGARARGRGLRAPPLRRGRAPSARPSRPCGWSSGAGTRPSSASTPPSTSSGRRPTTRARAATSAPTTAPAPSSTPVTPHGDSARYISGFSCEKGTVESEEAMLALTAERKKLGKKLPQPGGRRVQAAVPPLLRPAADARGGRGQAGHRGAQDADGRPAACEVERTFERAPRRGVGAPAPAAASASPAC